jgi:hypothetical protein
VKRISRYCMLAALSAALLLGLHIVRTAGSRPVCAPAPEAETIWVTVEPAGDAELPVAEWRLGRKPAFSDGSLDVRFAPAAQGGTDRDGACGPADPGRCRVGGTLRTGGATGQYRLTWAMRERHQPLEAAGSDTPPHAGTTDGEGYTVCLTANRTGAGPAVAVELRRELVSGPSPVMTGCSASTPAEADEALGGVRRPIVASLAAAAVVPGQTTVVTWRPAAHDPQGVELPTTADRPPPNVVIRLRLADSAAPLRTRTGTDLPN